MLENADALIFSVKNRAMHFSEPLSDIIRNLSVTDNKKIADFCSVFTSISDLPDKTAPEIWNLSVDMVFGKCLKPYECDVIKHFSEKICFCNKDDISRIYTQAHNDLNDFLTTAKEIRNTRTKSTAAISISSGLMIVLMLI